MKRVNTLFCVLLFSIATQAQGHEPVNTKTDRQEFNGYIIKLLPASSGTYGYDILKGPERIVHQSQNPFTASPRGLATKQDAYKLAQWQITQLNKTRTAISNSMPAAERSRKLPAPVDQQRQANSKALSNGRLSPAVAKSLKITITY